jgi:hypothetical protein
MQIPQESRLIEMLPQTCAAVITADIGKGSRTSQQLRFSFD